MNTYRIEKICFSEVKTDKNLFSQSHYIACVQSDWTAQ
jgi:hypothetical protein